MARAWREFLEQFAVDLDSGRYYPFQTDDDCGLAWYVEPSEEKVLVYHMVLISIGINRIGVMREVHRTFNIPLSEAKALIAESRPTLGTVRWNEVSEYRLRFSDLGAAVEFVPASQSNQAAGVRQLDHARTEKTRLSKR